jgi:hypothetical protein
LPHLQGEAITTRAYIPRSQIERIQEAWKAGHKVEEIIKQIGVSRATAYRYRPTLSAVPS